MREARWTIGALICLAIGSLGCLNIVDGRYGAKCEVDDDCGISSTRACLGGYCSGQRCNFESSDCDRNLVCEGDRSGLLSDARCFKECSSDDDCPETWSCSGEVCRYSSYSRGTLSVEVTKVATGEDLPVTLVVTASAGAPSEITWYARGYNDREDRKVGGPSSSLTYTYNFEEAGLYSLEATFQDANGVTTAISEDKISVCGREGAACDDAAYAHCCEGTYCMNPDGESAGVCATPPP